MLRVGAYTVDPASGRVTAPDGSNVPLRNQSLQVLRALAERSGAVVAKDALFDAVWGDTHVTDDSLVQCIAEIRKALDDGDRRLVETIPRKGYRLNAGPAVGPVRRKPLAWLLGGAAAVVAIAGVVLTLQRPPQAPLASNSDLQTSILILPLLADPANTRASLLAMALGGEIAADLGRHKTLRVVAPFGAEEAVLSDLKTTADVVLSGAMEVADDKMRVNVALRDAADDAIIWSERWTQSAETYFDVRDTLLDQVTATIASTWTGAIAERDRSAAWTRQETDLTAYENYLVGSFYKHGMTQEGFEAARSYLERAVEIDPGFSRAWVSLYYLNSLQGMGEPDPDRRAGMWQATRDIARRLRDVAPEDPFSMLVQSVLFADAGDYNSVHGIVRRAVARAPSNPDLLAIAALTATKNGALAAEAKDWVRRAHDLNPAPPPYYSHAGGYVALAEGDFDTAAAAFSDWPGPAVHGLLAGYAAAQAGRDALASAQLDKFIREAPAGSTVREVLDIQTTYGPLTEDIVAFFEASGYAIPDR